MAVITQTCLCPADSPLTALVKINNNMSALFFLMSAGLFRGATVNLGACLCSELQILATLNNNISGFFTWFVANGNTPSTGNQKAGLFDLATNSVNQAIAFDVPFPSIPSVVCTLVPTGGGDPILVDPQSITVNGFTASWGFAVPAGYKLAWIAQKTTQ